VVHLFVFHKAFRATACTRNLSDFPVLENHDVIKNEHLQKPIPALSESRDSLKRFQSPIEDGSHGKSELGDTGKSKRLMRLEPCYAQK
jgi:hypothetical protein